MKTKIKIKTWKEMENKYGLNMKDAIWCEDEEFLPEMKYLCEKVLEIELDENGIGFYEDWRIMPWMYLI